MFRNHLKIALRNLIKHKQFSLINILGLAIGLACFILIMLWVQDELSYDKFHDNSENIYITTQELHGKMSAATSQLLAPAIKRDLPEIIDATSALQLPSSIKSFLQNGNIGFEENLTVVDNRFFELFSFKFKHGVPQDAVLNPNSIVLTERIKQKYFGNEDALGKSLNLKILGQQRPLEITGILENIPHNSHLQYEIFIPISFFKSFGVSWEKWDLQNMHTYILTQANVKTDEIAVKISNCRDTHANNQGDNNIVYSLLPLHKIHLHANIIEYLESPSDIKYVYIFSAIAAIILLIACMNYMNLANALSLKRTKEIGIQKVIGANRREIVFQYIGETFILTLIALGFAIIFIELILPVVNHISQKSLSVSWLKPEFLLLIFFTIIGTGIISGLYPAIFISGFKSVQILKGILNPGKSNIRLHKTLIIFQFSLSVIIIICTVTVYHQLNYIQNKNLGFDKENIICVNVNGNIHTNYQAFKTDILGNTSILGVTRSEPLSVKGMWRTEDMNYNGRNKDQRIPLYLLRTDADFASVYKIKMQEGRYFSDQFPKDKTNAYVVNEAAIREMGLDSPLGKEIELWGRTGNIIGIAKDFHFNTFHEKIAPLLFQIPSPEQEAMNFREVSFRIKPYAIHESIALIKRKWNKFFPDEQFKCYFFNDNLNASYHAEQRMGELFKYFSLLAIFIACLGLHGLTAFTIEQKTKDIGVHKVLGATIANIILLLSKNYMRWIFFANLFAWPLAYFASTKWLQNFAYHIEISWWIFALAGGLTLTIALLTVSWQAVRAATANPIKALRYE